MREEQHIKQPVMAQILISSEVLKSREAVSVLAEQYRSLNCEGYLLWIDDLDETKCSLEELLGLMQLLRELGDKPKYNLYGGFFSILLANNTMGLLDGISHGLEYGESRKAYPVGGGIPSSKYYFYPLHQRLLFQDAFNLLAEQGIINVNELDWGDALSYHEEICRCPKCEELMPSQMRGFEAYQSKDFYSVKYKTHISHRIKATPETKENCRFHYLYCKQHEVYQSENMQLEQLISELKEADGRYKDILGDKINIDYLHNWIYALENRS